MREASSRRASSFRTSFRTSGWGVRLAAGVSSLWLLAAMAAWLMPMDPYFIQLENVLRGPAWNAPLGYDELGRDLLARVASGAGTSLAVAASVVSVSVVVGTCLGATSAWLGGLWDLGFMRVVDVFQAFPGLLLAIALAGMLGPGIENVIFALIVVGWVGFARIARAQTLSLKHREFVKAAEAVGAGWPRILRHHILPLLAAPIIVDGTFSVAAVVIGEASLSFLGVGVQPPAASWGSLVREGMRYMLVAPHLVIVPSLAICAVVVSINLLGDVLRDRLDVRRQDSP